MWAQLASQSTGWLELRVTENLVFILRNPLMKLVCVGTTSVVKRASHSLISNSTHHIQAVATGLDDVGLRHTHDARFKQQARSPWGNSVVGGLFFRSVAALTGMVAFCPARVSALVGCFFE